MQKVDVSIIAANYNNGAYLDDFFESIKTSSVEPNEIIIVDDGSTDDSLSKLKEKEEQFPNLIIIPLKKNIGFANALNVGIKHSQSEFILRVDPDDVIFQDRIKIQHAFLTQNKNISVVGSNATYFAKSKELFNTNFPNKFETIKKRYIKGEHGILHGTVMIRRDAMKKYQYRQEFVPAEDYGLFGRMIADGHIFANINQPLTGVRIHENSVSNDLPYNTIKTTFVLRDKIFNTKSKKILIYCTYLNLKFYRKFLFKKQNIIKYLFLILSITFRPDKVFRRIFNR
ncbi:glycosyltransferase [Flammeovirgaceae bacterium SG7u.111]|nr:glycosyltransferase [Flammeovirgaceae bacterium SG7u.132]WPO34533.1 glycosyltransferase [Flammeovirgaceae bacterium SG7u.111]